MRAGEKVRCPHCGENTVVKSRVVMDGWQKRGEVFVCLFCGGELGRPGDAAAEAAAAGKRAADRFAALLGEGAEAAPAADLTPDEGYGRFCRNCAHFLEHPFKTLCGLDGSAADPMSECPKFEKRK